MSHRIHSLLACVALLGVGCALVPDPDSGPSGHDAITREHIAETRAQTAYEAVEFLQPNWLRSRGPTSMTNPRPAEARVFFEGTEVGDLRYLHGVNVQSLEEIRYWSAGQASNRFGMGYPGGVIELIRLR